MFADCRPPRRPPGRAVAAIAVALLLAASCSDGSDGAVTTTTRSTPASTTDTTTTVPPVATTPSDTTLRIGEAATIDLRPDSGGWVVEMTVHAIERIADQTYPNGATAARYVVRARWQTVRTTADVPRAQRNYLALVTGDGAEAPGAPTTSGDGVPDCPELPAEVSTTPGQVIEFCDVFGTDPDADIAGVTFSPPSATLTWRNDG